MTNSMSQMMSPLDKMSTAVWRTGSEPYLRRPGIDLMTSPAKRTMSPPVAMPS